MPISMAEYRSLGKSAQLAEKSVNPYYHSSMSQMVLCCVNLRNVRSRLTRCASRVARSRSGSDTGYAVSLDP